MSFTHSWNRKSRLQLIEQMGMYVEAGLPLPQVISVMGERLSKKRRASLVRVRQAIESGHTLSKSLMIEIRPPPAVIGLIVCGEASGTLAETLKASHRLLEREDELRKKVVSSMTYPLVIGVATLGLTFGLVRGIMPQILPLLMGLHTELPLITRVVMAVSGWLMSYGIYALGGGVVAGTLLTICHKKVSKFRKLNQSLFLKIPVMGGLVRRYSLALFFQTFGALTKAGVSADVAYVRAVSSVSLLPLRIILQGRTEALRRGEKFHTICNKSMPSFISPLIQAGEASGHLGTSLIRAAELLDRELDLSLRRLTALIEPGMMIVMGGMVGSIAMSIMLPIYEISKTLQH